MATIPVTQKKVVPIETNAARRQLFLLLIWSPNRSSHSWRARTYGVWALAASGTGYSSLSIRNCADGAWPLPSCGISMFSACRASDWAVLATEFGAGGASGMAPDTSEESGGAGAGESRDPLASELGAGGAGAPAAS